ncbi:MAG: lipoyl-dependent peroxiredoxin [Chloroflexota bacterium]|jgi:osmotically inducible protein OsmC|nr:lipoyl-dependent peroxiredoxin [Chloroflexota bacterium]
MALVREAHATWSGDLPTGNGTVGVASGLFDGLETTWRARTEAAEGKTSPEELLAAAHASCFAMASSNNLAKAGFPVEMSEVTAKVTGDKRDAGWTVISSELTLRARVPNVDEETFRLAVEAAKVGCPISRALAGNVEITLDASLER